MAESPTTRLGLGTGFFRGADGSEAEADALAAVAAALEAGIRHFDTAPLYGLGQAERQLGRALAGVPRDSVVVSTKVGRPLRDGASVFDFSAEATRRSLGESLERLGLDAVDAVLVHDPEDHVEAALDGAYSVVHELRAQGVVKAIGVGTKRSDVATRFVRETDIDRVLLAARYTLLDQEAAAELFPACLQRGVTTIVGGIFNGGVLTDPVEGASFNYGAAPAEVLERCRRLAAVCARHDTPLAAAALQFSLAHPAVSLALTGACRPHEVHESLRWLHHPIPTALWSDLAAEGVPAPPELR